MHSLRFGNACRKQSGIVLVMVLLILSIMTMLISYSLERRVDQTRLLSRWYKSLQACAALQPKTRYCNS